MANFSFDRLQKAFGDGIDRLEDSLSIEKDPELRNYNLLEPQDFEVIVENFGVEDTLNYIQEMESRRMRGK